MTLVEIARLFRFVREVGGQNKGRWVALFQHFTGNTPGDSWCASAVSLLLGIFYQGEPPIPYSASCDVLYNACKKRGYLTQTPSVGDLYFFLNSPTDAHHVGIVSEVYDPDEFAGVAGNTSEDGKSNNGDRFAEHRLTFRPGKMMFAHLPPRGA